MRAVLPVVVRLMQKWCLLLVVQDRNRMWVRRCLAIGLRCMLDGCNCCEVAFRCHCSLFKLAVILLPGKVS